MFQPYRSCTLAQLNPNRFSPQLSQAYEIVGVPAWKLSQLTPKGRLKEALELQQDCAFTARPPSFFESKLKAFSNMIIVGVGWSYKAGDYSTRLLLTGVGEMNEVE